MSENKSSVKSKVLEVFNKYHELYSLDGNHLMDSESIHDVDPTKIQSGQKEFYDRSKQKRDDLENEMLEIIEDFETKDIELSRTVELLTIQKSELENKTEEANQLAEEANRLKILAVNAKEKVQKDLEYMKGKVQTQMMSLVIKFALIFIGSAIILVCALYAFVIFRDNSDQSSIMGNLLSTILVSIVSSSFAVISTILGIKEFSKKSETTE